MRAFDKSLELVVCGSSNADMKTYPEWERVVLEHTYDNIDHISLHMYFANRTGDTANYLALNHKLDRYISTVESAIRLVKANKRSKRDVHISFDEWNVWYHSNAQDRAILDGNEGWPHAPRLLEDIYTFEDVLQVGLILNTFIRKSHVVRIACIAQLVNVIAPIMTEPGGPAWKQTIYYPYFYASLYGRGRALDLAVVSPGYDSIHDDNVPFLDIAAVWDEAAGALTFFAVNRHPTEALETEISLGGLRAGRVIDHQVMTFPDLKATNSLADPLRIVPRPGTGVELDGATARLRLPPQSWQVIRVEVRRG